MLVLLMAICFIANTEGGKTYISLQDGSSATIPCYYDKKYKSNKKYWCSDSYAESYNYCKIQAYANNTQGKVTVTDYPSQSLFTVTMRDLQMGDSRCYWCVVEIEGLAQIDDHKQVWLSVKSDPDLSVKESRVSGEEGKSVSIECLYSAAYRKKQKQWCRAKDGTCYPVEKTETFQNSAVQISDDGTRSFTVTMTGLKKADAGWYWCSADSGYLQTPVHLNITETPEEVANFPDDKKDTTAVVTTVRVTSVSNHKKDLGTTAITTSRENIKTTGTFKNTILTISPETWNYKQYDMLYIWLPAALGLSLLLILLSVIIYYTLRKNHTEKKSSNAVGRNNNTAAMKSSLPLPNDEDVTYSTVRKVTTTKSPCRSDKDEGVIYSSLTHWR